MKGGVDMRNVISRRLAFYFMLSVMILLPYQTKAREIVGDVDGDGVVGLQEAIYALQVTSGSRPATIMDPDLTPQYSAWGTYTYSSGNITANFTFSNFIREGGPPPGEHVFQLSVIELSSTQMIVRDPGNNTQTWFRKMGSAGDVVGRWERTDGTSTFAFILDSDGSMHYSAYGDFLTKTVLVPNSTKVRYGFDRPQGRFCKSGEPPPDLLSMGGAQKADPVSPKVNFSDCNHYRYRGPEMADPGDQIPAMGRRPSNLGTSA
jgi:hypothetical protein